MLNAKKATIAGLALMAMSGISHANLITNGGFEAGNFSGWTTSGLTCSGVGSNFSSATGNCVGMDNDPGPASGAFAAYLGTAAGGGLISQLFNTTAGQAYAITYQLANGTYSGTSTPNSLLAQWNGTTLQSLVNASASGFTTYTFTAIATGSTTTLSFTNQQSPSFWVLDNVTVDSVPEPASLGLLGLGLLGLGFSRRKKA